MPPSGDTAKGQEPEVAKLRREKAALLKQAKEARILHEAIAMAAVTRSFEDALRRCIGMICRATDWPVGHAYLPAEDGTGELVPSGIWHWRGNREERNLRIVTERTRFAPGTGLPGRILSSGAPAWIPDIRKDTNFLRSRYKLPLGVKAAFGFPILLEGRVMAVLEFFSRETRAPDEGLSALMAGLGGQVGRVLERHLAGERLREAEAEMRGLSRRLIDVQEEERRRVARELHDGVIQVLSSAKFTLNSAAEKLGEAQPPEIGRALALVNEGVQEIRAITRSLHPGMLEHLGLEAALRNLCAAQEAALGLPIRFVGPKTPQRLTPELELTLYRIAQEGLANMARHAGAARCDLKLTRGRGVIRLTIEDDGRGFDTTARRTKGTGLGLISIRERAATTGGSAEISSAPGKGTRIAVSIPTTRRPPNPKHPKA